MNRAIRIGLIAEGEAELGKSIPYIKPEDGGKIIHPNNEGGLHKLIRRELASVGISDCNFVHRHPSKNEIKKSKLITGHSAVLTLKYLAQVVITWKPEEVDMIVIVVDADDQLSQRQRDLEKALNTVRENHLHDNKLPISDRSTGGLAITKFDTWLLADTETVSKILDLAIAPLDNIEELNDTKETLENAIAQSEFISEPITNQRPLQIRWHLATQIDLAILKNCCPQGYKTFAESLAHVARGIEDAIA
jgi:hypothetical protein